MRFTESASAESSSSPLSCIAWRAAVEAANPAHLAAERRDAPQHEEVQEQQRHRGESAAKAISIAISCRVTLAMPWLHYVARLRHGQQQGRAAVEAVDPRVGGELFVAGATVCTGCFALKARCDRAFLGRDFAMAVEPPRREPDVRARGEHVRLRRRRDSANTIVPADGPA